MFFATMVLRQAAMETLEPPQRLRLMDAVFRRFCKWVWGAAGMMLITGLYQVYLYGGIIHAARHAQIILALELAVTVIYIYMFFACCVPFSLHVGKKRWAEGEGMLGRIRKLIVVNLFLGLLTMALAVIGFDGV